jgi:hypothetical protein
MASGYGKSWPGDYLKEKTTAIQPHHRFRMRRTPALTVLATGLCLIGAVAPRHVHAVDLTPFYSFDQGPLVQIFGLPALAPARVTPEGAIDVGLSLAVANNFSASETAGERASLDGETWRTTLLLRRGFAGGIEFGIELPFVRHGGGSLDSFVESWHEFFGLPQNNRDAAPANRLEYHYERNGVTELDLTEPVSGVGDLRLTAAYQLIAPFSGDLALRASLKLPTGESAKLLGSGGTDLALWVSAGCGSSCDGRWGWYGGGGVLFAGQGEVLADQQRHWIGFGAGGLAYRLASAVMLKLQLDAHTDFFGQTDLAQIGAASIQVAMGGTIQLSDRYALDLAVSEELVHNTASDVVLQVILRARF